MEIEMKMIVLLTVVIGILVSGCGGYLVEKKKIFNKEEFWEMVRVGLI